MTAAKNIIVITGGSGFLAQHLIKEIQLRWAKEVKEIRVIDKKLFQKILDYPDNIPVKEFIADVTIQDEIDEALTGATMVFHMAARPYSFDMYPDRELYWDDNILGTKTLIFVMTKKNVPWLVYTSDALSVLGNEDAQAVTEAATLNPPSSEWWLLGPYGETKFMAEMYVRKSNEIELENGGKLRTISVRPTPLYGEGDTWFVPHALRICQQYGSLQRISIGDAVMQFTYAGNAAAMHLQVADLLLEKPDEFGGEVFNCTEDTRPVNYYSFMKPFIEQAGYRLSSFSVPFLPALFAIGLLEILFKTLYMFGIKYPHNLPNKQMVVMASFYFHFSVKKAYLIFDYKPAYDPAECLQRTLEWWKNNYKNVV